MNNRFEAMDRRLKIMNRKTDERLETMDRKTDERFKAVIRPVA
jgi:DNA anti-recombination protein RmuC